MVKGREVILLILITAVFAALGPLLPFVLVGRVAPVFNYAFGLVPAIFAGLSYGVALIFILRMSKFLSAPFDLFRCLYIGAPLGAISGLIGTFLTFVLVVVAKGFSVVLSIFVFMGVIGMISGALCGLVLTPLLVRYSIEKTS